MRVLISAFACEPHRGSEPGVGWNWAVQPARFNDAWVITHSSHRSAIEAELLERPVPGLRFEYVDFPAWTSVLGWPGILLRVQYLIWQVLAYYRARALHETWNFDVAQHVTFVSFRYPTFLAWLGVPSIWGPIGGGERTPLRFYPTFGVRGALYELLRDVSSVVALVNPLTWKCLRRATTIVAVTPDTARLLPGIARSKTVIEPAIGIEPSASPSTRRDGIALTCRALFVGQLTHRKGVHLLIPALAEAVTAGVDASLTIVGEGPLRRRLQRLVRKHDLERRVSFAGSRSRADVLPMYAEHDVFVFPSLQDSGGGVVLEAMASGLPVICLDLGGPGQTVTDATGIRVPARDPKQVVSDLGAAIARLASSPGLRREMGEAGHIRATERYSWSRKGDLLEHLYAQARRSGAAKDPARGDPAGTRCADTHSRQARTTRTELRPGMSNGNAGGSATTSVEANRVAGDA